MKEGKRPLWYLYLLLKNRWFLVKALLLIMIPTTVVTFMLKKEYTVTSLIMPPEEQASSGLSIAGLGISEFAGYFSGGMGFSLPLMTTMSDVYKEILVSRSLIEHVILRTGYIDAQDLREKFEENEQLGLYWARKNFRRNYSASVTPSGFLSMEFTSSDPWYSVEVMDAVIAALDSINVQINSSRLEQSRILLQERMVMAESLLASSIANLQVFEEEYGIIALEQEFLVFIESIAELKREYLTQLSEAAAIRAGIAGASSPAALLRERKAAELLEVINMLETGNPVEGYEEIMTSLSPRQFSNIQYDYASLRADYEVALKLSSAVRVSLQQAITAEENESPSLRILDPPDHPGWKSKPKRILILMEVFLLALVSLFGFLIARENIREIKEVKPELWEPWRKLLEEIRRDFSFRRK